MRKLIHFTAFCKLLSGRQLMVVIFIKCEIKVANLGLLGSATKEYFSTIILTSRNQKRYL